MRQVRIPKQDAQPVIPIATSLVTSDSWPKIVVTKGMHVLGANNNVFGSLLRIIKFLKPMLNTKPLNAAHPPSAQPPYFKANL